MIYHITLIQERTLKISASNFNEAWEKATRLKDYNESISSIKTQKNQNGT